MDTRKEALKEQDPNEGHPPFLSHDILLRGLLKISTHDHFSPEKFYLLQVWWLEQKWSL